jgi:hypothetical protein
MMSINRRVALTRLILVSLAVMGACSATRLAYDNADFLLLRWADRYIEPTEIQDEILEAGLDRLLEKHRRDLLPDYILFLRGSAVVFGNGLTRPEVQCLVVSFEELYARTVELAIPLAAAISSDLNQEQVQQLARRLKKDDARFARNWLQQERHQRLEKRAKRFVEKIEEWTGELYARQSELVTQSTLAFPDTAPGWYAYRLAMQAVFLRLVNAAVSAEAIEHQLRDWWIGQSRLDPELSAEIDAAVNGFIDMMVSLDATLTTEQRERVTSRLRSFADALEPALDSRGQLLVVAADALPVCGVPGTAAEDFG